MTDTIEVPVSLIKTGTSTQSVSYYPRQAYSVGGQHTPNLDAESLSARALLRGRKSILFTNTEVLQVTQPGTLYASTLSPLTR